MTSNAKKRTVEDRDTDIDRADLSQDEMGNNQLQGDDQLNVHNERAEVPDVRHKPDDVVESFEKTDKDVRAERDLGKGNRSGGN